MANIKKNFNFRNGVQVDDDNLLVTSTGLVGIGTTVPTEALDVRGNATISGFTSITNASIGIVTITTLDPSQIIGAGVSIKSGIITAQGAGIVTFFGDARFLQGMPTSQWQDVDVGLGYTSIFNTGGNVGIATTDPRSSLQIGNNVDAGQKGVGISSAGNINASGIISATSFVGDLTGNITGATTISGNVLLNADLDVRGNGVFLNSGNDTSISIGGTVGNNNAFIDFVGDATYTDYGLRVLRNDGGANATSDFRHRGTGPIRIVAEDAGIIQFFTSGTASSNERLQINSTGTVSIPSSGILNVDGHTDLDNVSVTGVSTFAGAVDINSDLDIDGHTNLDNLSVSGVSTFSGRVEGAATNNVLPFLYSSMSDLPSAGSYHGAVAHVHATGALYFAHAGQWWELLNVESSGRVGTGTENYDLNYIGAATTVHATKLGVGTTEAPVNDIQVRNSGNSEIQITSETGIAGLTFGRETGTSNTNNGELRYGGGAGFTYSSDTSLDIINYGTGNFNYHLSANNPGGTTGNFFWHKGSNNVRLMTLTNTGRLGIGLTNPSDELHVDGGATVSGALGVGGNINLTGTMIGNVQGTVIGNVVGVLAGNTNTTVGISTLNNLSIAGIATASRLRGNKFAVGENPNLDLVSIFISNTNKVFVNDVGQVGISTTVALPGVGVNGSSTNAVFNAIGVGVTIFTSAAVDLRDAGTATSRYMMPPKVNTSQRASLVGVESGAVIYNTSLNKLQVYVGSGSYNVANWQNLN